jgi:hypothetical protein
MIDWKKQVPRVCNYPIQLAAVPNRDQFNTTDVTYVWVELYPGQPRNIHDNNESDKQ